MKDSEGCRVLTWGELWPSTLKEERLSRFTIPAKGTG